MVKIHKSSAVILDSNKPVIINRPELGSGLRDTLFCRSDDNSDDNNDKTYRMQMSKKQPNADHEAEHLIAHAQKTAESLLEEARRDAFDIRRQAYCEAHDEARLKNAAELDHQIKIYDKALADIVKSLCDENEKMLSVIEPEILRLSVAIAEKIIGYELGNNEKAFQCMVQNVIERLRPDEKFTLFVNDKDFWHSLADGRDGISVDHELIKITTDPTLPRGSCKLEGSFGQLDAGVDKQINELKRQWEIG